MFTLGVDFGKKGGLTLLEDKRIIKKWTMPSHTEGVDIEALLAICTEVLTIATLDHLEIYGERLHAIFGSSAKSTFSFGKVYGEAIGVIEAVLKPITLVRAVDWQKDIFKEYNTQEIKKPNSNRRDTKAMALITANVVWPDMDWRPSPRHKIPHDGIIDSALIALYGNKQRPVV